MKHHVYSVIWRLCGLRSSGLLHGELWYYALHKNSVERSCHVLRSGSLNFGMTYSLIDVF
jgi:hypothetical protein